MKYLHVIVAIVSAFLVYPTYLRHGEWWAMAAVLGVALNFVAAVWEDRK